MKDGEKSSKIYFYIKTSFIFAEQSYFHTLRFPFPFIQSPVSTVKGGCLLWETFPPSRYPFPCWWLQFKILPDSPPHSRFPTHSANHIVKGSPWCAFSKLRATLGSCPSVLGERSSSINTCEGDSELRFRNLSVYGYASIGHFFWQYQTT